MLDGSPTRLVGRVPRLRPRTRRRARPRARAADVRDPRPAPRPLRRAARARAGTGTAHRGRGPSVADGSSGCSTPSASRVRPPALRAVAVEPRPAPRGPSAVETILEHLRAGDCYQVNLTRRLDGRRRRRSGRALPRRSRARNPAPHAALVRIGDIAVVSASPERFLRRDGTRDRDPSDQGDVGRRRRRCATARRTAPRT